MNEQWKRLIEAERRIARIESGLQRANRNVVAVQGQIQNSAQNVTDPFGSGGGGTGGMHRFPNQYEMWVEWSVEPTLKTGASSNPTADVTSLAAAVADMLTPYALPYADPGYTIEYHPPFFAYDTAESALYQAILYSGYYLTTRQANIAASVAKIDGGSFVAGSGHASTADGDYDEYDLYKGDSSNFYIERRWNRRNGIGTIIGTDTLRAQFAVGATVEFSTGPTYGESGTWSFPMTCLATTYHNAGSGTLYLRWGTPETPTFSIDGGSAGAEPDFVIDGSGTDFIFDGGSA